MSGASIDVRIDDRAVKAAFRRLAIAFSGDTRPVMAAIGSALVGSTQRRFASQTDPDGNHWLANRTGYGATKRNVRILTESGRLRSSINSRPSQNEVRIGTNVVYAAIHQFGGTISAKGGGFLSFRIGGQFVKVRSVKIEARPYLGISTDDREEVKDIVFGFIDRLTAR